MKLPSYIRRLIEKISPSLAAKIRRHYRHLRHSTGTLTWPTKSYQFWLLLQELLYLTEPQTLVEFGSGRSTGYLAEYASKFDRRLISIEEHLYYVFRINRGLRLSMLPDRIVRYVPVRNGWYDARKVAKLLDTLSPQDIEFLFLDGPTESSSGKRGADAFFSCIYPRLQNLKLAVIDDVHRPEVDEIATKVTDDLQLTRYQLEYGKQNSLAILLAPQHGQALDALSPHLKQLLHP